MDAGEDDPFEGANKKTIYIAKNTPAVVTVPGTGGDLHDDDPLSPLRIRVAAQAGRDLGREARVTLMQTIGARFGVPPEGFPIGLSRIYVDGDIRFIQTLRVLSRPVGSRAAAANLKRAAQLVPEVDPFLVLTTAARERDEALIARGSEKDDTFKGGGLDFLETIKGRLGLPRSIVKQWDSIPEYRSGETENIVHPARIPIRDQVIGYAAVTRLSFKDFCAFVKRETGDAHGQKMLDSLTADAKTVWLAYSFLSPGGSTFNPQKGPEHGRHFGVNSAFGYLRYLASRSGVSLDMNAILTTPELHHTDYVKVAKARAMEAAFFDHLMLKTAERTNTE